MILTWPVVEVVRHLWCQVEILTALALSGCREDHVPDPPLVPLVQPLVDLVHAAERHAVIDGVIRGFELRGLVIFMRSV